ncbi:MAG: NAD-dependent epimerase/dehydratase family protein, partial [Muribaculaceae bacterium]|nr:NAD-dependent epimerase/dehydratase family protein [Muribaculaceae bacterium]
MQKEKILIVGAGGFIGGFIAAEGLRRGYDVWVGVRQGTSMRYLSDPALHVVVFDYDSPADVTRAIKEALPEGERWKYVIHNLGATKCTRFSDFNRINFDNQRTIVESLKRPDRGPEHFLLM